MNITHEFDTITAIATPVGTGGVGVLRISGDKSFEIIKKIFSKPELEHGKIAHGWIKDPHPTLTPALSQRERETFKNQMK
ncbi:MAG: hypothetical protein LBJ74_01540, partial [Heliobacteriaceae bacterium]|nr:hypothetical protein [Heliobacteriaceae bacterium]